MKLNFKLLLVSLAALLLSGLCLVAGSLSVAADTTPAASNITLSYQLQTDKNGNQSLVLLAKLTRASDNYPLSQRTISFYETVNQFGTARVFLGTATTDATGLGTLVYYTRITGDHPFAATYAGDATTQPAVINATLNITKLPADLAPLFTPTGMEQIDKWGEIATGVVVLGVWALLIAVFFGTIRGIRRPSQA